MPEDDERLSTAERILKKKKLLEDYEEEEKKSKEEIKKAQLAIRRVFSTPDGQVLGRIMMRISGIYRRPNRRRLANPMEMAYDQGMKDLYIALVKDLPSEIVSKIEKKIDKEDE